MMRATAMALFALVLLGCGPKTHMVWRHDEKATDEDLNRDHFECRNELEAALPKSEKPEVGEDASAWTFAQATRYDSARDDHYKSCMESRGWRQFEVPVKGD